MNNLTPITHDVIDFSYIKVEVDDELTRFHGFLTELDGILRSSGDIIDSSFSRMGMITDEILEFARKVEIEMLRIQRSPQTPSEKIYSGVLDSNEVKMAFDLIMSDFVDRRNYLPERVKSDIDDTVGKLRNFLKHTLRDMVGAQIGLDETGHPRLYVQLYFDSLTKELKRTKDLLSLIVAIQTKFEKTNLTPEIFIRMRNVFQKGKLVSSDQWRRITDVLGNINRFFRVTCLDKKHLMRATDFFEFQKKVDAFSEVSVRFIKGHEALERMPAVFSISDMGEVIDCTNQFEGILLDLRSFLEFITYEVKKRECLNYKKYYLLEAAER